jgi:peptidoglycan/LPS O-acetylase OafA/YrhL
MGECLEARAAASFRRIVAIDVIRGFAILWVILYHLWSDMRFPHVGSVPDTFRAVPDEVTAGAFPGMLTAVSDAFFRVGYLGVPLFMMLSGLSLTLVALRREQLLGDSPRFWFQRFRRVMLPYWVGFALTVGFAAAMAWVQWQREAPLFGHAPGAGFTDYLRDGDIRIDGGQLFAGAALVPRAFRNDWQFAPEGSLWFVLVIVQYYLLFPFLFAALRRVGPWIFAAAALAVSLVFLHIALIFDGNLVESAHLIETTAPFRIFEFGLGMSLGWLLVRQPQALREYTESPFDAAGIVVIGLLMFVGACMIDPLGSGDLVAFQLPLVVLAMTVILLPLLTKEAGRLEVSAPARGLAWVGVISYTVLIINEPLRSVTHHMRAERADAVWLWLWCGGVLMPVTLLAARPLALLLRLVERRAPPVEAQPAAADPRALHA